MKAFSGFSETETFTSVPNSFFRLLVRQITDVGELKVALHAIWSAANSESPPGAMAGPDFAAADLGLTAPQLKGGLSKAVKNGILLRTGRGAAARYFLNSPEGRAAVRAIEKDGLEGVPGVSSGPTERPAVFHLYEENIGPLTPLIADALKDAEDNYSAAWIADAIEVAVMNNKRSWSYCEAILKRWKEEGRAKKQDRRNDQAARQRDVEEKIRRFIHD
jgi:DnaD/phage-associated family protein